MAAIDYSVLTSRKDLKFPNNAKVLTRIAETWRPELWFPLSIYAEERRGASHFMRDVANWERDKAGIYLIRAKSRREFTDQTKLNLSRRVFYVGRAGEIARRFYRHLCVRKHNSASLAYKITAKSLDRVDAARKVNMGDKETFVPAFLENQKFLAQSCEMAYLECINDHRQAILEILLSLRLKSTFNDWHTH